MSKTSYKISKKQVESDIIEFDFSKVSENSQILKKVTTFKSPKDWACHDGRLIKHKSYRKYLRTDISNIFKSYNISDPHLLERELTASVFPFKVSGHLLDLINWDNYQEDPLFNLTFPQSGMLDAYELSLLNDLKNEAAPRNVVKAMISKIRSIKNPAPSGQKLNKPILLNENNEIEDIDGIQHKYSKTCLFFHRNAQTCHAYCTYCFRFNQFVEKDKFLEQNSSRLHKYLLANKQISDLLVTGGDPAVMKIDEWKQILTPLLDPSFNHIRNIRLGTKALTYHPYRFLTEPDADDLIELFQKMVSAGKHISIMAHVSHYNELGSVAREAIKRLIKEGGCAIRTQSPIMKHINDDPNIWAKKWELEVSLGMIPYYMFVARDTGPKNYYEIPLSKASKIFQDARKMLSGLSHTARGPSMSATPGKIVILGDEVIKGEHVFILKFLQGRNANWCSRVFFAAYDENATWIDQLKPAFGEETFFYENEAQELYSKKQNKNVSYASNI